jgi:hypothetical protein
MNQDGGARTPHISDKTLRAPSVPPVAAPRNRVRRHCFFLIFVVY